MKYRLPELNDKSEIVLYIQEHYARGENSLSASNMLTLMPFEEWIKKCVTMVIHQMMFGENL